MKRKDKVNSNAIHSEFIFDRTTWLQKSKERESKRQRKMMEDKLYITVVEP